MTATTAPATATQASLGPRAALASIPITLPLVLLAGTSAVVGAIWDISWHRTIGRDTFWTPAHMAIYLGGVLAGVSCGWHVLRTTLAGSPEEKAAGVRFWGFKGPLGAWVAIWGAFTMITSAPFDNWWHNAYGLDVKVLSPPHALLALGFTAIQLGALFLAAAWQNRSAERAAAAADGNWRGWALPWLVACCAGILLTNFNLMGFEYIVYPNDMHTGRFYTISAGVYPMLLLAGARAARLRYPAAAVAAVYMGITMLMIWILQLFEATPKLAPIYNPVTHMVAPPFPALLIVPALAIDVFLRRFSEVNDWVKAVAIGVLFLLVYFAVQWLFSIFLLSPASENFLFGAQRWNYNSRPGPWMHEFWDAETSPVTTASLLVAMLIGALSARLGLWAGRGLARVKR